jgi:hypothetical protein
MSQGRRYLIDVEHATIASVNHTASVAALRRRFGSAHVVRRIGSLEGQPDTTFVISIDGHEFTKHWNYVSTTDSIFKTRHGVGVGSTVAAFARYYGQVHRGEGEGASFLNLSARGYEFQVRVSDECFADVEHLGALPACAVQEILL